MIKTTVLSKHLSVLLKIYINQTLHQYLRYLSQKDQGRTMRL